MKTTSCLLGLAVAIALPLGVSAAPGALAASYARLPLRFEPNHGQTAPEVRFLSRGSGYTLFLTDSSASMVLSDRSIVRMRFAGASNAAQIEGRDALPGKVHYFRGHDSESWRTNIPTYARVAYQKIYPGIDLFFYGNERQLEYDFVVAAGADPRAIRLTFEGVDALRIDADGNLVLTTSAGEIVQKAPIAYQESGSERKRVRARYRLQEKNSVAFALGKYDRSRPLVIDPVLMYSTFLGGSGYELIQAVAADSWGSAYVTGHTQSLDFPNPNGVPHSGTETFVTKIDANGQTFVYTAFIAGSYGVAIAVDANGRPHVTGLVPAGLAWAFPWTPGAYQTVYAGGAADAFVARLNFQGIIDWATFLGGKKDENGFGIGVDSGGNVAVAGFTDSGNFPTWNAFQSNYKDGLGDMFVTRLNPTGSALIFSSFLGGSGLDSATGLAVDSQHSIYVTGYTDSDVIPDAIPSCKTVVAPYFDAFVAKVSPSGTLVYSKCVGGTGNDVAKAIAVDQKGHAYVTGKTFSSNFPLVNAIQSIKEGQWNSYDAFVFKVNPAGSGLNYSTYLGGDLNDYGSSIAVDDDGYMYVAGGTYSRDFPTVDTLHAHGGAPWSDAFLTKITPTGSALVYSTFLGGEDDEDNDFWGTEWAAFVAVDFNHIAYVAGNTKSEKFPLASPVLPSPAQPTHANPASFDGWVVRVQ